MTIELRSQTTGRICKLAPKAFGKLLHLAKFHGWDPEQVSGQWPSSSWNTEIILPHVGAYMTGSVSKEDAEQLCMALERVIDSESSGLDQKLYFAALGVLEVAKSGVFDVALEKAMA
jgi:hypothetical protein